MSGLFDSSSVKAERVTLGLCSICGGKVVSRKYWAHQEVPTCEGCFATEKAPVGELRVMQMEQLPRRTW